jgi:hypothetical protein
MKQRTKRFNVGDKIIDRDFNVGTVAEAHCDPHPLAFSHCSGNSARYVIHWESGASGIGWDWQLSPAPTPDAPLLLDDPAPSLEEANAIVAEFKRRFPLITAFFSSCKTSSKPSDSTPKDATPAA